MRGKDAACVWVCYRDALPSAKEGQRRGSEVRKIGKSMSKAVNSGSLKWRVSFGVERDLSNVERVFR